MWALGSNYYILNQFKKDVIINSSSSVYKFEKQQYKIHNKCIYPLQILFMKLGIKVLKNINNNKHKINIIKQQLINSIYKIMETNDKNMVKIVIQELTKLQKLDYQILSFEGIVFKFNDRICKLTGSFPIINKIEGLLKYERNRNNLNEFQYYGVYNLHKDNTNKTLAKKQNKIAKVIKIKIQQYLKSSEQLLKLIKQSMTNINNLKYANPVLKDKFEDVLKYIKIFNKNFQIMNDWVQRMHTVLDMKEYENYNQLWLQTMRKIIKNTIY